MKTHRMWAVFDSDGTMLDVVETEDYARNRAQARFGCTVKDKWWEVEFNWIQKRFGVRVAEVKVREVKS